MSDFDFKEIETKMQGRLDNLSEEFAGLRAGRANPKVLDKIVVDYYGAPTPIPQMAAVSMAEARVLQIQPWDVSTLKNIERAINESDLGIPPQNDGKVIRLTFPQMTEERRKEQTKLVGKYGEECKVSVRNIRRDAIEALKKMEKDKELSEDERTTGEKKIQDYTDRFCKKIDEMVAAKEKEILSI